MTALSGLTGLSWDEMADDDVIWFMLKGMRPVPRPFDKVITWYCRGSCEWSSPRGRGGERRLKEAVRQHLRDKHQLERPRTRIVRFAPPSFGATGEYKYSTKD